MRYPPLTVDDAQSDSATEGHYLSQQPGIVRQIGSIHYASMARSFLKQTSRSADNTSHYFPLTITLLRGVESAIGIERPAWIVSPSSDWVSGFCSPAALRILHRLTVASRRPTRAVPGQPLPEVHLA
jgi:hypothetical protein